MAKQITNLDPKGRLCLFTYLCDAAGVGHIRTIFPSLVLNATYYKEMSFESFYSFTFIQDPNFYSSKSFVRFQRSATKEHLDLIRYFKNVLKPRTSTPVLYEIDDNLFDIPDTNFAKEYYVKNRRYIEEILKTVDGITVSTPYLKEILTKYNSNISIVPNYLLKSVWGGFTEEFNKSKKLRILYPGSSNHFALKGMNAKGGDMDEEFLSFIRKTTDKYTWVFVGGLPYELEDLSSSGAIEYHDWQNILTYPVYIKNLKPDIGIAPLEICNFNRAKSNIKALEYTAWRIPGVFTDIDPYSNMPVTAKTTEEFISKIEQMEDADFRRKTLDSQTKILDNFWMEDNVKYWINQQLKLFGKRIQ